MKLFSTMPSKNQLVDNYFEKCRKYNITKANIKYAMKYRIHPHDSTRIVLDMIFLEQNHELGNSSLDSIKLLNLMIKKDLGPTYDKIINGTKCGSHLASRTLNYYRGSILYLIDDLLSK